MEQSELVPEEENVSSELVEKDSFAEIRSRFDAGETLTSEETDKIADLAVEYLMGILNQFGESKVAIDEYEGDNGEIILDISGGDLAVLIGRHGHTLDALQMVLSSLMSSTMHFYYPVVVDIENYKGRRKRKLEDMARYTAENVRRQGHSISMSPMNAFERRVVHMALVNEEGITTYSKGEDPERCVVVAPAQ